ncbi:MAG TPA: sigma-54 dependent transcriptional regulator [Burkholderiales bacterium]|nr:sigma-54 dependent transcriptional regulator [Burkholderiales bacterium]
MISTESNGDSGFRVVLVEDDDNFRRGLVRTLEMAGFEVFNFREPALALESISATCPHVVLTDLYLGSSDGLQVLAEAHQIDPDLPVVLMTAGGNIPTAIKAIREGAYDFLEKPFDSDRLVTVLKRASEQRRLTLENRSLKDRLAFASGVAQILRGDSVVMRDLRDLVLRLAPTPANVIILGETGTGKELVARCLHEFSGRRGNFVAINCTAIPENLFESELFGHEAGSYTGATKQRIGKVEHASGGTLFLDEIEAMPIQLQAKMLRVLQERQVERLGSNKITAVDLRVVAATKVDLRDYSARDKFRMDLFFRLNVATVKIPPLRERREDVPMLLAHFIGDAALRFNQPAVTPPKDIHQQLLTYDWPGNVRELRNVAEQLQLGVPISMDGTTAMPASRSLNEIIASVERAVIEDTLRRHDGAANAACNELQINYSMLYRKMKSYNIDLLKYRRPEE